MPSIQCAPRTHAKQVRAGATPPRHLRRCRRVRPRSPRLQVHRLTAPASYNAKVHQHLPKLRALLASLAEKSGLRPEVVVVRHPFGVTAPDEWDAGWTDWDALVAEGAAGKLGRRASDGELEWKRLDFNWPLWILFSSGTTGASASDCVLSLDPRVLSFPKPEPA